MKNNIKKAPVKFREDPLYFQHFMLIFVFAQISDYHHLNVHVYACSFDYTVRITCMFINHNKIQGEGTGI